MILKKRSMIRGQSSGSIDSERSIDPKDDGHLLALAIERAARREDSRSRAPLNALLGAVSGMFPAGSGGGIAAILALLTILRGRGLGAYHGEFARCVKGGRLAGPSPDLDGLT